MYSFPPFDTLNPTIARTAENLSQWINNLCFAFFRINIALMITAYQLNCVENYELACFIDFVDLLQSSSFQKTRRCFPLQTHKLKVGSRAARVSFSTAEFKPLALKSSLLRCMWKLQRIPFWGLSAALETLSTFPQGKRETIPIWKVSSHLQRRSVKLNKHSD